ncbi:MULTISPECIES: sugar transferase [unclassified Mycobacterium]|jgi:exopolysaccharide biosynthesis polyprenyl glycosylphosphotransferase|uniref:sugar transferase n=1 Tax=unclassified Mycobacterium TaxID=2642494 RepID=UPI000641D938|nr:MULTISPECIES: sugar transferase [unclassified Mycobacterium]AKK29422.1 UDP-phosphate galactose phosphotransferase [Mycobacterium sp. EPa45]
MAIRTLHVERPPATPVHNSKLAPRKKTFAERVRTDPLSTIITVAIDVLSVSIATALGTWWAVSKHEYPPGQWWVILFVPVVIAMLGARGVYRRRLNREFLDELGPIEATVAISTMFLLGGMLIGNETGRPGATVVKIWLCAAVLMPFGRLVRVIIQRSLRRHHHLVAPTLIVGNGRVAGHIINRLEEFPEYGLGPVGIIDAEPWFGQPGDPRPDIPYLGPPEDINKAIRDTGAQNVVIAFSRTQDQVLTHVVRAAHQNGLRVWVVPRMFDTIGERARIEHIGGTPLLALPHTNPRGWQFTVKHIFDRVASFLLLLLISPVFLSLVLLVKLSSPGPIFFRQPRVGRDGRVFDCLKFRTMRAPDAADAAFRLKTGAAPGGVEGVDRRTKIGKILRATSLDELPQFLNVLRGEMSLVGPRPERPEFVELFEAQIQRYGERHRVRAGVTGWAQVHGLRGQTSIADRAEWDNYYIENFSIALDLKILALTVPAVLRRAE